ncbi:POZ domain-containing protein [Hypoxylon trugodes]|uniref:POZ domain-containing protein n=1 Tax=Hypoxylon trugodes TaxID=326681 RepID=UPI00219B74A9|nr:POZ domain-containing protein [Hypoxylon trugodes]KAI1390355.1 POZ domain-containing protein [Hypoxylon trugodes]
MAKTTKDYLNTAAMLSESGKDLLNTSLFSDVTVKCGDRTWKLHKAIICPRNPFFSKVFNGRFQEAATGELTLVEQNPKEVGQVIQYLYTGKVSKEISESWPIELFKAADFFQIKGLADELYKLFPKFIRVARFAYGASSAAYTGLQEVVKNFAVSTKTSIIKDDCFLELLKDAPGLAIDMVKALCG